MTMQYSCRLNSQTPRSTGLPVSFIKGWLAVAFVAAFSPCAMAVEISANEETIVGAEVEVTWSGDANSRDFITIVAPETAEGKYEAYQYARRNPVVLVAPVQPGNYEIRYLGANAPYPTLARRLIQVNDSTATLQAPDTIVAGAAFDVSWTGPDQKLDFITIVPTGTPEGEYASGYAYTSNGPTLRMVAPDTSGTYELRYLLGQPPYRTLGSLPVQVTSTLASIEGPVAVAAGSLFTFTWQGPDNPLDFITIVPRDAPDSNFDTYVYTQRGNPAELVAPDLSGDYELRYLTGQSNSLLARMPISVTPVTASVSGPVTVESHNVVSVVWEGPDNPLDHVIIQAVDAIDSVQGHFAYTSRGRELRIATPEEPGEYEYRYVTGQSNLVLARQSVTVVPRPAHGTLRVINDNLPSGSVEGASVTVVLDASGSMLQRIEGERRIDIAKASLDQLIKTDLPAGVHFSLHVFGHKEVDSCRTDLEIPLGPLDRSAAAASVAAINAMNLARTPIAATLARAGAELTGRPGPHLIILLTDGEETCDGNPAEVIGSLIGSGLDVRVNIVGFAIDELMLRESFQEWARLGHGTYLDAHDAAELSAGLSQALAVPYEVRDAGGAVIASGVVNGPALELLPGDYTVRIASAETALMASVVAYEEALLTMGEP